MSSWKYATEKKCKGKGLTTPKLEGGLAILAAWEKAFDAKMTALGCNVCTAIYKPKTRFLEEDFQELVHNTRSLSTCDAKFQTVPATTNCMLLYSYVA